MKNFSLVFIALLLLQLNTFAQTKFAVIGDYGRDNDTEGYVADMINGWGVEFIITTGDNSYGSNDIDDNIGKYYSDWIGNYNGAYGDGSLTNRFFPTIGNHDYTDGGGINAYLNYFTLPGNNFTNSSENERYYDFVWDNVHFFGVNSNSPEPDSHTHPGPQSAWAEEQITNCVLSHLHWRIVYFHHAPYSSQKQKSHMRWPFYEWEAHTILAGHSHTYERIFRDDIVYFVNGLGGKTRYECGPLIEGSQGCYDDDYGAQLVTVSETEITFEFWSINRDAQGIPQTPLLIDSYTIVDGELPIELISFSAKISGKKVLLNWTTESEVNNYGFEILRSTQDDQWDLLGFVEGHGNSNLPKSYSFVDNNPLGGSKFKYRLKQIDTDGSYEYSDVVEVEIIPEKYALFQNYPNPFNPSTKITYTIPEISFITMKVYDVLGSEIITLVNEEKPVGSYEINFNASNLPSGVYFYRIQAGDFIKTKKMVLMK